MSAANTPQSTKKTKVELEHLFETAWQDGNFTCSIFSPIFVRLLCNQLLYSLTGPVYT